MIPLNLPLQPFLHSLQALRVVRVQDFTSKASSTLCGTSPADTTTLSVLSLGWARRAASFSGGGACC